MTILKTFDEKNAPDLFSHHYLAMRKKNFELEKKKRVIVISGPTGVGKTDLSIAVAKAIGGEIVSADSMQVYRGMDIGTAKISKERRKEIPHHLIDTEDLYDPFNAVLFFEKAHMACRDILLRDKVPIVVGGSGFYIHCFLYGPPRGPASDKKIRGQLEQQMKIVGPEVLYERLQMLDPQYAATITDRDRHKIVRALEIILITEKGVSSFSRPEKLQNEFYEYRCWFLYRSRETLYARVEKRCEEMLEKGLIKEVQELKKAGLAENLSAAQAIGYRQCLDYLRSEQTEADKYKFLLAFKKASRQYVKKQITWFKKEPLFRWLNLEELDFERALEFILQDFEQGL